MNVERLQRGQVKVDGTEVGASVVANSLLGLRDERPYLEWLKSQLGGAVSTRTARRLLRDGTVESLRVAARETSRAHFPYEALAPALASVRRVGVGRFAVPSAEALAAFAMHEAWQLFYRVHDCDECGLPWLRRARDEARYCNRPAPGRSTSCAQIHAHDRFAVRREMWNREYRRINARKQRGTVAQAEWDAWRHDPLGSAAAPAGAWLEFDIWKPSYDRRQRLQAAALERNLAAMSAALKEGAQRAKKGDKRG